MPKIKIVEEHSFGYENQDRSICVPDEGKLSEIILDEDIPRFLSGVKANLSQDVRIVDDGCATKIILGGGSGHKTFDDYLSYFAGAFDPKEEPKIKNFSEHLGCSGTNSHMERSFPAVEIYPFYLVWVEERNEWLGIKFHYIGCDNDLDGKNEDIETSGPYKLGEKCARLIAKAYSVDLGNQDILYTSPAELEKIASGAVKK